MAFHFWNSGALVRDLALGHVTENDTLKFAVANGLLIVWANYWGSWFGGPRGWDFVIELAVIVSITVFGTYECFRANGGASGRNFLRNFVCLSLPVNLKVTLIGLIISLVMYFGFSRLVGNTFRDAGFAYMIFSFFVVGALAMAYYWRVSVHLSAVAAMVPSDAAPDTSVGERNSPTRVG